MVLAVQAWAHAISLATLLLLSLTMPPFCSCEHPSLPSSLCPLLSSPGFHTKLSVVFTVMSGPGACAMCCIPGSPGGPQTLLPRAALEARMACIPRRAGSAFLAAEVLALGLAAILFHGSLCCSPFPPTPIYPLPSCLLSHCLLNQQNVTAFFLWKEKKVCVGEKASSSRQPRQDA